MVGRFLNVFELPLLLVKNSFRIPQRLLLRTELLAINVVYLRATIGPERVCGYRIVLLAKLKVALNGKSIRAHGLGVGLAAEDV